MNDEFIASVTAAYEELYDPPTRTIWFTRTKQPPEKCAVVVYVPTEAEQRDPDGNVTLIGTAGFGAESLCVDQPSELGVEIKGALDEHAVDSFAAALVELASAPVRTGRLFSDGQVLSGLTLPRFSRFTMALLVDWDSVYGFRFPEPASAVGLLRIVPLFPEEVDFVENFEDRHDAYRALIYRGLDATDPERAPVVQS
ncbi:MULTISPECIES: suppressor of fused domain protein [Streptomyces]|nr:MULTISPECIES: suppressor of fused domain protein [Streptomyces]